MAELRPGSRNYFLGAVIALAGGGASTAGEAVSSVDLVLFPPK